MFAQWQVNALNYCFTVNSVAKNIFWHTFYKFFFSLRSMKYVQRNPVKLKNFPLARTRDCFRINYTITVTSYFEMLKILNSSRRITEQLFHFCVTKILVQLLLHKTPTPISPDFASAVIFPPTIVPPPRALLKPHRRIFTDITKIQSSINQFFSRPPWRGVVSLKY